jgi:NADH-quinone oxidoreductase subunit L
MDTFSQAAWLVPLFPLAAFLVLLAVGRGARRVAPQIGMVGSLGAFVLSLLILMERLKPAAVDLTALTGSDLAIIRCASVMKLRI